MMRKFGKGMADKAGRAMVKKMAVGGVAPRKSTPMAAPRSTASMKPPSNPKPAPAPSRSISSMMKNPTPVPSNPSGGLSSKIGAATAANSISRAGGISSAMKKAVAANQNTRAKGPGMKKGGAVFRKGADGVAHKGKTKGKMVKMNKGGYC